MAGTGRLYNMTLDVQAIGKERANLVSCRTPCSRELPRRGSRSLRRPSPVRPTASSSSALLRRAGRGLVERLGRSGTIVYMPECDRLTSAKAQTLVDHAIKEMARITGGPSGPGLRIFVNNRLLDAFDPTYSMPNARHVKLEIIVQAQQAIFSKSVQLKLHENGTETAPITIKLFQLPIEDWSTLPKKVQRNDLRIFDGMIVSVLRNDRELFAGVLPKITTRHSVTNWWSCRSTSEAFSTKHSVSLRTSRAFA